MTLFDRPKAPPLKPALFEDKSAVRQARTSWLPAPAKARIPETHDLRRQSEAPPPRQSEAPPPQRSDLPPAYPNVELQKAIPPMPPAPVFDVQLTEPEDVADPSPLEGLIPSYDPVLAEPSALEPVYREPLPVEADPRVEQALAGLTAALEELAALRTSILLQAERELVELSGVIAKRVIGGELTLHPSILARVAREGIDALAGYDRVTVRLSSGWDDETVEGIRSRLRSQGARCEVVVDQDLAFGQCLVETDYGRVDESLDTRLETLLRALLPDAGEARGLHSESSPPGSIPS